MPPPPPPAPAPFAAVGAALSPALGLVLLPVARGNVFTLVLGVPYERLAVFHRLAAQACLSLLAAHVAIAAAALGPAALRSTAPTAWGRGYAYGTAAAACLGALALLASPPVRERAFTLFKASHLLLAPTSLLLACLHARVLVAYVLPPLGLYALDRLRGWARAASRPDLVATATPLPGGAVRLALALPPQGGAAAALWALAPLWPTASARVAPARTSSAQATFAAVVPVRPGVWAYVCVPGICGGAQWHPLSVASPCGPQPAITFIVGGASRFGARLAAAAAAAPAGRVAVRLDGPYGRAELPLTRFDAILLCAGGVGVTAMARERAAGIGGRALPACSTSSQHYGP